jgi:polysaccharide biosynthesis/export protein
MKLKKSLWILSALALLAYGAEVTSNNKAIVEAIKSNPSLLEGAEAKKFLGKQIVSQTPQSGRAVQSQPSNAVDLNASELNVSDLNVSDVNTSLRDLNVTEKEDPYITALTRSPLSIEDPKDYVKRLVSLQTKGAPQAALPLTRYGIEFFTNKNGLDLTSLPVPSHYKIVPNDVLSVILYGPKSENMSLTVDKDGSVVIPSFGPLNVAGLTFSDAKKVISDALMAAFPNVGVTVNIAQFSTIQVSVAGEVVTPGLYNLNSFSTLKEALIAAGGVSANGTMREVMIKRNGRVVSTVDLYRIIRGTAKSQETLLKAGDVIVVPVIGKSVIVDGNVKRPAIYEAKGNETLFDLITYAGGLSASANKNDIRITRYDAHEKMSIETLSLSTASKKKVMDQDKIYVYGIDVSNVHGITLYGNVIKPGFWPLVKEGISVKEFFKREIDQNSLRGVFLEQTHFDYAVIKRTTPSLKEELIGFSLSKALSGEETVKLYSRDELYILNKTMAQEKQIVQIGGECIERPGEYRYFDKMTLQSLLATAGVKCPIDEKKITILSRDSVSTDTMVKVVDATQGGAVYLSKFDEVFTVGFYTVNPHKTAIIKGEVYLPGEYPIGTKGLTLRELILASGGMTDKASREKIEIVSYVMKNGTRTRHVKTVDPAVAMSENSPIISAYDEVSVYKIPQWGERKTVKIYGNVKYPGEYSIEEGDRLSDLITRVGGFTDTAYLNGAVFTREELKKRQQEGVERQIKDLEQRILFIASQPTEAGQSAADKTQLVNILGMLKEEAKKTEFVGRLAIQLQNDMRRFEKSSYNVLLKNGDALYIPEREDSVIIQGEVLNPNAVVYRSDYSLQNYLEKSGGLKDSADEKNIFVIHANGEAETFKSGYLFSAKTAIGPGDVIVVPMQISTVSGMQFAKDITSILYQLAVSVAALNTIGAF